MPRWTVPDQDTGRRIVLSLRYGWRFLPGSDSEDGKWHATKDDLDLMGPTLGAVVTECEDHELMREAESGQLWDRVFTPGEPDPRPLATVLALHRMVGVDPRSKLPCIFVMDTTEIYSRPSSLDQRF